MFARCALVLSLLAGLCVSALTSAAARAKPPRPNGQIVVGRYDPVLDDTVLYRINPDGTHEQQVLPFGLECPRWSPDGSRIATCGNQIGGATAIIDPDSGTFRAIPMPLPDTLFTACPVWSPDARRLVCESFGFTDPALNGLYTMRVSDGRGLTRMTSNPGGDDLPGDYSPDGRRFVFARFDANGDGVGLFVARVDGSGLKEIAPVAVSGDGGGGSWSPRGNEIVFSRRVAPDQRYTIWLVHSNGKGLRELHVRGAACGGSLSDPTTIGCPAPSWSPDGRKIVFSQVSPTGQNVFTVDANGRNLTQITHGGADEASDWGTHPPVEDRGVNDSAAHSPGD